MSITHVTPVRNALADEVVDRIDVGAGTEGDIEVATDATFTTILVVIPLNNPAFGNGGATTDGVADGDVTPEPEGTVTVAGTAANFRVRDANDAEVFRGTVTTTTVGTGDMQMSSVGLSVNDVVRLTSMSYTAAS